MVIYTQYKFREIPSIVYYVMAEGGTITTILAIIGQ